MIQSVEMSDPKPTSDNPASSERNRRTIGEWFRTVMTKRSHNRIPPQTRAEAPSHSGIPSQTKATPPNEKPSTMAPGKRQARTVYSGGPKKEKPLKTTRRSEAGPSKVPDETKAEPSGAQNSVEREAGGLSSYTVYIGCSLSLPSWMCCGRTDNNGGTH